MFHIVQKDDASVIKVSPDLDLATAPALESALSSAANSTNSRIIVSFAYCGYCDSSGLSVIARAKKLLGDRLLLVVPVGNPTHRIFAITGFDKLFHLYGSVEDALEAGRAVCR